MTFIGEHLDTKHLDYSPGWLSCDENYLFIPDLRAPALRVYTWDGDPVKTFDHQLLGLKRSDVAYAVSPVNNGIIIMHCERCTPTRNHFFKAYRLLGVNKMLAVDNPTSNQVTCALLEDV